MGFTKGKVICYFKIVIIYFSPIYQLIKNSDIYALQPHKKSLFVSCKNEQVRILDT